jgi:transcriptional regulator with XRE-family HTH domain
MRGEKTMVKKNDELREVIAARIRAAREGAGLSQGQVAKKLKMHRPTISEIEAGRRSVSSEELGIFARLFGVETWWLACSDPEEGHDASMAKYEVAARHLSSMNPDEFDSLMKILATFRKRRSEGEEYAD